MLPPDALSPSRARRFVTSSLRRWQRDDWDFVAGLLVTELVTNAVLHARTEITVALELRDEVLRIRVADGSPRRPQLRGPSTDATTGRGLGLVEQLSRSWGVDSLADGKSVWVELGAMDRTVIEADEDHDPCCTLPQQGVSRTHASEGPSSHAACSGLCA